VRRNERKKIDKLSFCRLYWGKIVCYQVAKIAYTYKVK